MDIAMSLSRDVGSLAIEFLDILSTGPRTAGAMKKTGWGFSDIIGTDHFLVNDVAERMGPGARYDETIDAKDQVDIFWPIDFSCAASWGGDGFHASRLRSLEPKEVRGIVKIFCRHMVLLTHSLIPKSAPWFAGRMYLGLVGEKWTEICGPNQGPNVPPHNFGSDDFGFGDWIGDVFRYRFAARYSWHVAFSADNSGTRLVLPTNPTGCLRLFRSRDLNPGEKRRAALRHWVNEHYRNSHSDPDAISYIRNHLRGNTKFQWNGLGCEIMVSEFDLEKYSEFKAEADSWRAMRRHNYGSPQVRGKKRQGAIR